MKQENYVIGLDLGINNVGWSILNLDNSQIEKTGVRLFNPSNDASGRRGARSVRRRLKRAKLRVEDLYKVLDKIDFKEKRTIDDKLIVKRYKAISSKVEKQDIVNILCFLFTHRGYIPFDDEEINFVDLKGLYPCEYYYNLYNETGKYRAINETVKTGEIRKEIEKMLDVQSEYYPELGKVKKELLEIFDRKREFWEGPGSIKSLTPFGRFKTQEDVEEYLSNKEENSMFEKYIFEDLIGKCDIYINEKCAPKLNYYAQKFNLLNDFINITFKDLENVKGGDIYFNETKDGYKLNEKGLNEVIDYCINCVGTLKIDTLLKDIFNTKKENISGFRVDKNNKVEISTSNEYRSAIKIIGNELDYAPNWFADIELFNLLMYYINVSPSSTKLIEMLKGDIKFSSSFEEKEENVIKEIFDYYKKNSKLGYHSLSEKALVRACNDMISTSMNFQQCRMKFDYDKEKREYYEKNYLVNDNVLHLSDVHVDELIASPQVKKTLRQSIKVINAIIDEKGSLPYCIAIESTKEMNGKDRVNEINREQKINEENRNEAKQIIEANGYSITDKLVEKVMLYKEINGHCAYCNKTIDLDDVLNNRIEVEHILPISKSLDNSFNNKTIACSNCNREKGNRTPYQWMDKDTFALFEEKVKTYKMSEEKKKHLLYSEDIDKYSLRFFNRSLRDTSYATKALVEQINMFNYFLNSKYDIKINTLSTPGQLTSRLRTDNDLVKNRDDGKYHHAVDASIVASIANTNIGKVIIDSQNNNKFWITNKDRIESYSNMLKNINISNNIEYIKNMNNDNVNISFQVLQNAQKQLSNANIVKYIEADNNINKVSQIDNIYEEKNSDLLKYFEESSTNKLMIKHNNKKLYTKLKEILDEYKDEKGNAFVNYCVDKYGLESSKDFVISKHGIRVDEVNENSPIVKKLRYYSVVTNPFMLNKESIKKKSNTLIGLDSLKQYCTEVYYDIDNNKFAFLPIYSVSVDLKTNKIIKNDFYNTIKKEFIKSDNTKFIARLYNGSCISVQKKNGTICNGFISNFDKYSNRLELKGNLKKELFTTGDQGFTLYDVDVLGNKKERLTFNVK